MMHKLANKICLIVLAFLFLTSHSLAQESRTWSSAGGKFTIEAKYISSDGTKVILEKSDGTKFSVLLDKLSLRDQGVVKDMMAAADDANPFKKIPDGDSNNPSHMTEIRGSIREFSVDFTKCPETTIVMGKWKPGLNKQPDLPFTLKSIALPGKRDFFEGLGKVVSNAFARRTVVTHRLGRHGKPTTTRLTLVDLENGKVIADAVGDGKWEAIAIHDDGERIIVQNLTDGEETKGQLGTVRLKGTKILPIDLWKPYGVMKDPVKEKIVQFCRFINNGQLLTLSQNGIVVIWDYETRKAVRRFRYHGACEPSLTHDRKHLAICGGDIVGFVNLEDKDDAPSVKKAPLMNYWLQSSFSPSCKRFAAATMQKLMVWDVESGDVLFEGKIPGLSTNGELHFPHEDFVIINGDKLVEFASGIKVWRYHGATLTNIGGKSFFLALGSKEGRILPAEIPHQEALTWLDRAKADSDLFVLKKGAKVALDLTGVPDQYRGDVEKSLKQQFETKGFVFDSNGPITFKASITGPTNEAVTYHFAGSFVVQRYISSLNLMYQGKSIWASNRNNVPGSVSGRSKEQIKQELAKAGMSPNIHFYSSVYLPDFLQKPTGDGKSADAQMLGASKIGLQGLE